MSIIYDALKKAENAINKDSSVKVDSQGKLPKSKSRQYLLYGLVVCLGLFIGNIIFSFLTYTKHAQPLPVVKTPDITLNQVSPEITQPNAPSESSEIQKPSQENLVLNGVFFSQDEGYALINNQIVKEGDAVGGATVKSIKLDEVELENDAGVVVKLSTQQSR